MAVYQDKAKDRIKNGISAIRSACKAGKKKSMAEADTRAIVERTLVELLGYDPHDDITREQMCKGGICDFQLMHEGKPYAIIEVKRLSGNIKEEHGWQARDYAMNQGIEWVLVTNGAEWQAYHLYFIRKRGSNPQPDMQHLFTVSFLDTETKLQERVDLLYLLSKEAIRHRELDAYKDLLKALSPQSITKRMLAEDVIDRVRIGIKNDIGLRIDNDEIAKLIVENIREEAIPPNIGTLIKRLSK